MKNFCSALLETMLMVLLIGVCTAQERPIVLIAYYSAGGHTKTLAEAVAKGARSIEGVEVKLLSVTEATTDDVRKADAIVVGSPVYNANVAPPVQQFINQWPFSGSPLRDKLGAAFVTAGGISAGEELVQLNILHSMLVFGMIVVGGPDWTTAFGASVIVEEQPSGEKANKKAGEEYYLRKGEGLGRRVAELTVKWKHAR